MKMLRVEVTLFEKVSLLKMAGLKESRPKVKQKKWGNHAVAQMKIF
jgi:hypothetical protein